MSTKDKIRWLKAAAQLLTSVDSFLENVREQSKSKNAVKLSAVQDRVHDVWAEIQGWIIELGGHD